METDTGISGYLRSDHLEWAPLGTGGLGASAGGHDLQGHRRLGFDRALPAYNAHKIHGVTRSFSNGSGGVYNAQVNIVSQLIC